MAILPATSNEEVCILRLIACDVCNVFWVPFDKFDEVPNVR